MDRSETIDLRDGFGPRMSDTDALLWSIEKDPLLRSTVTSIAVLDRAPDRDRLRRRIDRATRRVPRLRQRVVSLPLSVAPPRWEVDPHFDLRYHLRWMKAVGEGTLRELFDIAEPIAMQGFDRARPLWELTVVEGLADGRAALVAKIHHTITAGPGGARLQAELVDRERRPAPAPEEATLPPAPAPSRMTDVQRLAGAVTDETMRQARGARDALSSVLSSVGRLRADPVGVAMGTLHNIGSLAHLLAPAVGHLSPLMSGRSLSVRFGRIDLPRDALATAGRLVGGQLDDAIVAGLAGGLGRYHRFHGHLDVGALRVAMPLDVEGPHGPGPAANRFVPMRFTVPVDMDDPLERLNAVRFLIDRERAEPALALSSPLANMVNRLPATATTALFSALVRGVDVVVAAAPGPEEPVYVGGSEVEAQVAFGPLAGAAVGVTAVTYGEQVNLGISVDPAAVPDPDVLLECLTDGYEEVLKLV